MAAYEVLLLNTAIPQIQAAQSGDTYLCPRELAVVVNSATDAVRITQTGTGNALLVEDAANPDSTPFVVTAAGDVGIGTSSPSRKLTVWGSNNTTNFEVGGSSGGASFNVYNNTTNNSVSLGTGGSLMSFAIAGSDKMYLDSSGNLGLGVTPSVWSPTGTQSTAIEVKDSGNSGKTSSLASAGGDLQLSNNAYYDGAGWKYVSATSNQAANYYQSAGSHVWRTATSGTAGNAITFTQAMTLDASGNLGLGETNPAESLEIKRSGSTSTGIALNQTGTSGRKYIIASTATGYGSAGNLIFYDATASAERARITSDGYFKASNSGTYIGSTAAYHESYSTASNYTHVFTNTNASPIGPLFLHSTDLNGTANEFWNCIGDVTSRAALRSNGGLANYQANDVNLSDQRTKKDIVAAPSYWDKIKGIEIVHFKYKDQTHDDNNVGVIAQQVEQVAPEFVDQDGWGETPEDGVPLKSIYTSDMYHAAIKALQEAMARIETLEAEVAALKGA